MKYKASDTEVKYDTKPEDDRRIRLLRYIFLPLSAALVIMLFRYLPLNKGFEGLYTYGISRKIISAMSLINRKFPFSAGELIIVPFVILYFITGIISAIINFLMNRRKQSLKAILRMINLASVLLILFYIIWGFNYRYDGLRSLISFEKGSYTTKDLAKMSEILINRASQDRIMTENSELFTGGDKTFALKGAPDTINSEINNSYEKTGIRELSEPYVRVKSVKSSVLLSYSGISGMFFPYTGEANVNTDQPAIYIPSSFAHEAAHVKGIAKEDEANLISYIVCSQSDDPGIRYSGEMMALVYSMNRLREDDMTEYRRLRKLYTDGMNMDLKEYSSYWDRYNGVVSENVEKINDSYLKANMTNGVKDYEGVVALLLDLFRKTGQI